MFTAFGVRSLYRHVCFLKMCSCLTPKVSSCTFPRFNNLYSTSWPLLTTTKPTRKLNSLYFISPPVNYSTKSSRVSKEEKQLNKRIISLKTVEEGLELFKSVKNSASIVNRVTLLYSIAKVAERDRKQKQVLERKSQQRQSNELMKLLESISKDISNCQPRHLANILWALGKINMKHHQIVQDCEQEILSQDIVAYDISSICQIVNGCANLNLMTSNIFTKIQDAILNGQVTIHDIKNRELSGILLSFSKRDTASVELYDFFLEEILSRDFMEIDNRNLAAFVWSFAVKEMKADRLFDRVEKEILRQETIEHFHNIDLTMVLSAFGKAGKGSKDLLYLLDNELDTRGVEWYDNAVLSEIVWSFAKRNMQQARVFDLVKSEVFNRGVQKFQTHELVLILWSFASAQRHDEKFVAAIEGELCLRDVEHFDSGRLCQVAWSLGRAGKSDSKLFDTIEAQVLQRGAREFSMKENCMLTRGFIEAQRGSREFYELLVSSFSTNDFSNLHRNEFSECAWCFSESGVEAGTLFDALEKEILTKDKHFFNERALAVIKESFQNVGKGSKELFEL